MAGAAGSGWVAEAATSLPAVQHPRGKKRRLEPDAETSTTVTPDPCASFPPQLASIICSCTVLPPSSADLLLHILRLFPEPALARVPAIVEFIREQRSEARSHVEW